MFQARVPLSTTMCCGVDTDPGGRTCAGKLIAKNIAVNQVLHRMFPR